MKIILLSITSILLLTSCDSRIDNRTSEDIILYQYEECMKQAKEFHQIIGSAYTYTRLDEKRADKCKELLEVGLKNIKNK